jgi:hypothetical protein
MKIVFLDFDGVLNWQGFLIAADTLKLEPDEAELKLLGGPNKLGPEELWGVSSRDVANTDFQGIVLRNLRELSPVKVDLLNKIIDRTDAAVVVSSSWRHGYSVEGLHRILVCKGFTGDVIDKTGTHGHCRGDEIQAWLDAHPYVEKFCILDDGSDMGHLMSKLVHTSFKDGLLPEHVEKAVAMLV